MDQTRVPGGDEPPEGRAPAGDVVGLELSTALQRLGRHRFTLRFTAPPRPRGEKGAVRVIARRASPGEIELICAREYWERGPGGNGGEVHG
ncbi:MAG: hypothetical protein AB1609_07130 [Bacillota bacterium]